METKLHGFLTSALDGMSGSLDAPAVFWHEGCLALGPVSVGARIERKISILAGNRILVVQGVTVSLY